MSIQDDGVLRLFIRAEFGTDTYDVLKRFPMLWAGWECDEWVMLVRVRDRVVAIGSNHGGPILMSKETLIEKCSEYADVLSMTLDAVGKMD